MQATPATFWDGDSTKQSFISVVGLSTPISRTRSRPSSAPVRAAHTPWFNRPRIHHDNAIGDATEHPSFEVGGRQTGRRRRPQDADNDKRESTTHQRREYAQIGRVRVLEHRLKELMRENACMRDAMLNRVDEGRLEKITQAKKRHHELMSALQTAKEGAEEKARRTQERVRALQVQLRRKNSQQEPSRATQQCGISYTEGRLTESLATSTSRPASAPQRRCQANSDTGNMPTAAGILTTSMTVGNNTTPPSTPCSTRPTGNGGKEGTSGGAGAKTKAGSGKDDERASPGGINLERHKGFVACRPEATTIARRTPSPKKCLNVIATEKTVFSVSAVVGKRESAPTGVSVPAAIVLGETFVKQKKEAVVEHGLEHDLQKEKQNPRESVNKVVRDDGGNNEVGSCGVDYARSGGRSNYHDTAPKVLLARGVEAALRREERAAAARKKEDQEIRLSSCFRAKELHPTSGPDWATIKAHQDIVRKQRTRDRAAFLAATSSLPARMARHAAMQAIAEDRAGSNGSAGGAVGGASGGHRGSRSTAWTGFGDTGVGEEGGRGATETRIEEPEDIGRVMQRRQERWEASLAAAKASSRIAATRPQTPPMEKRRLVQEAKRRAREKAEQRAQEAAAKRRVEEEKRQFQRIVAMHRDNGSTFRETKASVRKAEQTRLKIQQDLQREEQEREEELADEARRREVSRAVREYVRASEARRREKHGAGPPLEELIQRKKDEKNAEFLERRRLNRSGLRQALRKRPNLLERQEKFAQQHSRLLAEQASTARDFLEGSEGFSAAGRRALQAGAEGGWMARAAADDTFSPKEKEELGLLRPVVVVLDGNDSHNEGGGEIQLHGREERQLATQEAELAGKAEHTTAATTATTDRPVDGSARSNDDGTPPPQDLFREPPEFDEGGSAVEEKGAKDHVTNEHSTDGGGAASDTAPRRSSVEGGGAPDSGPEGGDSRKDGGSSSSSSSGSSPTTISPDPPTDEGHK